MGDDYYYYEDDAYGDYGGDADAWAGEDTWETPLRAKYDDAKFVIDTKPDESVRLLTEVMAEDPQHGMWTFKCLKKIARALRNAKRYDDMLNAYTKFAGFSTCPEVDEPLRARGMSKFMDRSVRVPSEYQKKIFDSTLTVANPASPAYTKLWLSTLVRKASLLMEEGKCTEGLTELEKALGQRELSSGEISETDKYAACALLLQGYNRTNQLTRARAVYFAAMHIDTANGASVPQRVLANVLEWGGHMYMRDSDWHAAHRAFTSAFRYYSEGGDVQATAVLKMAAIADMICGNPIDCFSANEGRAGADSPSVRPVVRLLGAFLKTDVRQAAALVHDAENKAVLADDPLIAPYMEPLLFRLRLNRLIQFAPCFTSVSLEDVAAETCLESPSDATDLCTFAILQGLINGSIDSLTGMLLLQPAAPPNQQRRSLALRRWSDAATRLTG